MERVLGYKPEELTGNSWLHLVHPGDLPRIEKELEGVIQLPGNLGAFEARIRHKDGSWRILEGVVKNFVHDSAVAGLVANSRDITDRKNLEEQLMQAHKMEAIGTLAGGIAHDFNNILAAIIGYTEMTLMDVSRASPTAHYLEKVLTAAQRAKGC